MHVECAIVCARRCTATLVRDKGHSVKRSLYWRNCFFDPPSIRHRSTRKYGFGVSPKGGTSVDLRRVFCVSNVMCCSLKWAFPLSLFKLFLFHQFLGVCAFFFAQEISVYGVCSACCMSFKPCVTNKSIHLFVISVFLWPLWFSKMIRTKLSTDLAMKVLLYSFL